MSYTMRTEVDGEVDEPHAAIATSWWMVLAEELDRLRRDSVQLRVRSRELREQAAQLRQQSALLRAGLQD